MKTKVMLPLKSRPLMALAEYKLCLFQTPHGRERSGENLRKKGGKNE